MIEFNLLVSVEQITARRRRRMVMRKGHAVGWNHKSEHRLVVLILSLVRVLPCNGQENENEK